MTTDAILTVQNLTTRLQLGKRILTAVDSLSFDLKKGKTLALVGESGCGKSMTALSLMRILPTPPALHPEGEVLYRGQNLLNFTEKEMRKIRGAKIAMIFQDPMSALNPVYTIGSQLMEVVVRHLGLRGKEAFLKIIQALDDVGIPSPKERVNAYPHQLSGGMKQRVMIAMALLCEPDVLIADEPTTALDVTIQKQIIDLMKSLQEQKGMAILLITHDMGVVNEMADEVIVMYATKAVEWGSVKDVQGKTGHPYTEGLFKALPSRHQHGERLHVIKGHVPSLAQLPEGCRFNPRCPYVMDVCLKGEVPAFPVVEGKHQAKCWLFDKKRSKT
ncbi:MAG: ABC transporter ATP-binding protein [Chlamydiales bacterium]